MSLEDDNLNRLLEGVSGLDLNLSDSRPDDLKPSDVKPTSILDLLYDGREGTPEQQEVYKEVRGNLSLAEKYFKGQVHKILLAKNKAITQRGPNFSFALRLESGRIINAKAQLRHKNDRTPMETAVRMTLGVSRQRPSDWLLAEFVIGGRHIKFDGGKIQSIQFPKSHLVGQDAPEYRRILNPVEPNEEFTVFIESPRKMGIKSKGIQNPEINGNGRLPHLAIPFPQAVSMALDHAVPPEINREFARFRAA